jgi:hypothetical protein
MTFKILTLSIFISLLSIKPSDAVLGLSKCEKITKSVNQEQSIGLINWKAFDKFRDQAILKSKLSFYDASNLNRLEILVFESDIKISNILNKNTGCFNPKIIASNQQGISAQNNNYQVLKSNQKNFSSFSLRDQEEFVVSQQNVTYWSSTYQIFYDWSTGKKLAS